MAEIAILVSQVSRSQCRVRGWPLCGGRVAESSRTLGPVLVYPGTLPRIGKASGVCLLPDPPSRRRQPLGDSAGTQAEGLRVHRPAKVVSLPPLLIGSTGLPAALAQVETSVETSLSSMPLTNASTSPQYPFDHRTELGLDGVLDVETGRADDDASHRLGQPALGVRLSRRVQTTLSDRPASSHGDSH